MPVVVVHKTQRVVGIFATKSIGVGGGGVERREGGVSGGRRHCAEGGVLIVRGDAASRLVGYKIGDVLVSVVEVEEVVSPRDALHPERASGNRLSRIPSEGEVD